MSITTNIGPTSPIMNIARPIDAIGWPTTVRIFDSFIKNIDYKSASTVDEFIDMFNNGDDIKIPKDANIILPKSTVIALKDNQHIHIEGEVTTQTAYQFQVEPGATAYISGNESTIKAVESVDGRGIVQIPAGGTLYLENITLQTNYNPRGWTIDVEGGTVYLSNVNVICDNASLCTVAGSEVHIDGGSFYSTASSDTINGVTRSHNYSVRIDGEGTKGYIKNANIFGVQGGLSVASGGYCEVDGGTFEAAPVGEYKNSFYACYVCTGGEVVINDGYFKASGNKPAIYNGNNDTTTVFAKGIHLKGGYYPNKGYNQETKGDIEPAEGYMYTENNDETYVWKVVKA